MARDPVPTTRRVQSLSVAEFGRPALLAYTLAGRPQPLAGALAERGVALLHAHFGPEGAYGARLARAMGVPLVTTLHGFDVTVTKARLLASRKPSWVRYVTGRGALFRQCARFICVSEHIRRRAVRWGYPEDKLTVLPIGVDVDLIAPAPAPEAPRVLHVARLVAKKGTADLLKAFAVVARAVPGAELVVIGEGPLRASLAALAVALGVGDSVRFLGAQPYPETLRWVRESRLLCLPSVTAPNGDEEGLGMVLLEAAATGRPVVGTDHGGIPEAVVDGTTGYLVPEHDVTALAERIVTLLRDPGLGERLGKAGREMVVDRFNLHRQTGRLEELYRSLL